jgi:hypothetical protein
MRPAFSLPNAPGRFLGYRPTGASFRRGSVEINGPLTSTWCVVLRAVEAVCAKEAIRG